MVICYVLGYLLMYINPGMLSMLSLEPAMILKGQIWRLVTWVISPAADRKLPVVCNFHFLFLLSHRKFSGAYLGTFRYNLYIFSGLLFVLAASFLTYFITGRMYLVGGVFTTYYVSMSVFLAYAACYPNMQILLWFVIPIKMKWMEGVRSDYPVITLSLYVRSGSLGYDCADHCFFPELYPVFLYCS